MIISIMHHVFSISVWFLLCQGYARTEEFNPKQWAIPGLSSDIYAPTPTNDVYTRGTRLIKSKVIADLMEALIGAYLSTAGQAATFLFLEKLGTGIRFHPRMSVERPILSNPEMFVNINELEKLLNYKFNDPSLLVEALTHGSYQISDVPRSYQVYCFPRLFLVFPALAVIWHNKVGYIIIYILNGKRIRVKYL
jgi:hypothetical protein